MRHRNSRAIATAPSLIRETERRCRTRDRVNFRIAVVLINLLRRRASLAHGLAIESPILIPCHFHLGHKERTDRNRTYRCLIRLMERLTRLATHLKRTTRNRLHLERDHRTWNLLNIIGERGYNCRFLKEKTRIDRSGTCRQTTNTRHLRMAVIRIIMARIQVATDTLKIELLLVLLIIKVSRNTIIRHAFRKKILVAILTRLIRDILDRVLKLRFQVPIHLRRIFSQIRPDILKP